jgi:hypothetical protein
MCIILCALEAPEIDAAESALATALVAMVGGTRPIVSEAQVLQRISQYYKIPEHKVQVCKFQPFDFLLIFSSSELTDCVLHAPLQELHRWCWSFNGGATSSVLSSRRCAIRCC